MSLKSRVRLSRPKREPSDDVVDLLPANYQPVEAVRISDRPLRIGTQRPICPPNQHTEAKPPRPKSMTLYEIKTLKKRDEL